MQRNGTGRSLIGMFLKVLCYHQQIYILYSGWQRWLQGIASYASADGNGKIIHAPVKPLRLLKHGNLPVKISYDNNWKAIMELLEEESKKRNAIDTSMIWTLTFLEAIGL
jgi:hypothetical protein